MRVGTRLADRRPEARSAPSTHLGRDQGRAHIAVAEFGAEHLVGLALLDIGDAGERRAGLGAFRRVVADVGAPHRAPFAPARPRRSGRPRRCARRSGGVRSHRTEQVGPAPARERRGELPGQVDGVAAAGIHAEAAGGDDQMHGIAGQETRRRRCRSGRRPASSAASGAIWIISNGSGIAMVSLNSETMSESCGDHAVQGEMLCRNPAGSGRCDGRPPHGSAGPCRSGCAHRGRRSGRAPGAVPSRLPSPLRPMPSCLRIALAPPSQPAR